MGVTVENEAGKALWSERYDAVDFYEAHNAPAHYLINAAARLLNVSPTELTVERGDGVTTVRRLPQPVTCHEWDVPISVSRPGLWRRLLRRLGR